MSHVITAPGSLIGKALNVFSGAEHRKLRAICSFFPHDDNTDNPNVWEAYAESFGYLRFVFIEYCFGCQLILILTSVQELNLQTLPSAPLQNCFWFRSDLNKHSI